LTSARQRGLQEASGDIVAFIDADARLPPHWLDTVKRVFDAQPDVVALTGPYRYHDGPRWRRWALAVGGLPAMLLGKHLFGMMIVGGNFVARKQALEAMGGFDPTISFYGEDADVARRIKGHGIVVFRSDFFVYTSTRRYDGEGLFAPTARYWGNFLWVRFFHRPFSTSYRDIRPNQGAGAG
jgi:cellulose synthase/poly-beta-1,6-N-acetylglucosamine synthase-like glycosyltransferase